MSFLVGFFEIVAWIHQVCMAQLNINFGTSLANVFLQEYNWTVHGPLKLRTVHFGDITIIYESKVSKQNIFTWLKGTIESRPHTKF
jgi:hypothetical protein